MSDDGIRRGDHRCRRCLDGATHENQRPYSGAFLRGRCWRSGLQREKEQSEAVCGGLSSSDEFDMSSSVYKHWEHGIPMQAFRLRSDVRWYKKHGGNGGRMMASISDAVTIEKCRGIACGVFSEYMDGERLPDYDCGAYDFGPEIRRLMIEQVGAVPDVHRMPDVSAFWNTVQLNIPCPWLRGVDVWPVVMWFERIGGK